ncbi:hypothetical protein DAI22_11g012300 [Oryza sativa Japonica Group]|nr:hypothetical protein DAI22_11g012300 [Oryza sativa Japonica Group]
MLPIYCNLVFSTTQISVMRKGTARRSPHGGRWQGRKGSFHRWSDIDLVRMQDRDTSDCWRVETRGGSTVFLPVSADTDALLQILHDAICF